MERAIIAKMTKKEFGSCCGPSTHGFMGCTGGVFGSGVLYVGYSKNVYFTN